MSAADAGGQELVDTPSPDDILLGWETRNEDHSGNLRLKELIKERAEEYICSDYQNAKVMIVRQVAEELTEDGGRFLCKSVDSGDAWVEAQRDYVLENIKQAFRETVSSMTSSRKMSLPLTLSGLPATPYDSNSSERGPDSSTRSRGSPPHLSLSSNSSMERSQRSLRLPSSITVTPPAARLSPEGRLPHGLASTKEMLLRRLAAQQQQQQQQQLLQHSHRSLSSSSSSSASPSSSPSRLSPLDEATRRRKLHMAKMQAMLQQNRQQEHQLMTQLLRGGGGPPPPSSGRSGGGGGAAGVDAYATGASSLPARLAVAVRGGAGDHHSAALLSGPIPPRGGGGGSNLDALRANQLPAQLRLTPLGTRRQLDPLAPNRKRKRGSAIV